MDCSALTHGGWCEKLWLCLYSAVQLWSFKQAYGFFHSLFTVVISPRFHWWIFFLYYLTIPLHSLSILLLVLLTALLSDSFYLLQYTKLNLWPMLLFLPGEPFSRRDDTGVPKQLQRAPRLQVPWTERGEADNHILSGTGITPWLT